MIDYRWESVAFSDIRPGDLFTGGNNVWFEN
jgi:hypothetical protein